jgi:lysophospholipase L1-like esterase
VTRWGTRRTAGSVNLGRPPTPAEFAARDRRPDTTAIVVCAGDSITEGRSSGNFVQRLYDQLGPNGHEFVNAGVGGELAFNLLARLDEVIACGPDAVTILIGSNDVAAHIGPAWLDTYLKNQNLPESPTIATFERDVRGIVARLQDETAARVALIEIPPIGEDLTSAHNARVRSYNELLHQIGADAGVAVLPLHRRLVDSLPPGHRAPKWRGQKYPMTTSAVANRIFRQSWDRISDRRGFALLTDNLHLNDRSAGQVVALVREFLMA